MKDYAKLKALAQQIIECIGDESEGEDPSLPKQVEDIDNGGQDELYSTPPNGKEEVSEEEEETDGKEGKKKNRAASLAMMSSVLASRCGK